MIPPLSEYLSMERHGYSQKLAMWNLETMLSSVRKDCIKPETFCDASPLEIAREDAQDIAIVSSREQMRCLHEALTNTATIMSADRNTNLFWRGYAATLSELLELDCSKSLQQLAREEREAGEEAKRRFQ